MQTYPAYLTAGVLALVATVAIRLFAVNRLIRRKLSFSTLLLVAYIVISLTLPQVELTPEVFQLWNSIAQLVVALALINMLVTLAINPLRSDRIPERFPNIVQDALVVGAFGVVGTVLLGEKFLTTSAVGAVVVGFALQDTLGNAFAGLAIQIEKPFRVGHWIAVVSFEGQVVEITWRATKLRTKAGNLVIVPNNIMSKEAIANYSEPVMPTRLSVFVGASYDAPPNYVKAAMLDAINSVRLTLPKPPPEILLNEFAGSAVNYEGRFWIADFRDDQVAMDQARSAIYYYFKRRQIEIPFPIQTEISKPAPPPGLTEDKARELTAAIAGVDVFSALDPDERVALMEASVEKIYAAGETIVRQDGAGASMFIVCSGRIQIVLEPDQELAIMERGEYFGEMSLLTGDRRTATAKALTDAVVLEITADAFRRIVWANPTVIERIGDAVAERRLELEAARRAAPSRLTAAAEGHASFLNRVRQFLQIPGW